MVMLLQLSKYLMKAAAKAEAGAEMAPLVAYLAVSDPIENGGRYIPPFNLYFQFCFQISLESSSTISNISLVIVLCTPIIK